jgi:hypothetical protein
MICIITLFGLICIMIRTFRHAEASDEQRILMSMQALECRNDQWNPKQLTN